MAHRLLVLLLPLGLLSPALLACTSREGLPRNLHAVYVESLSVDQRTDTPVLLLKEQNGTGRELPIWIGMPEAQSIAMAMEDVPLPRPNTHDLIKNILSELRGDIQRVVITELRGHTYYAVIKMRVDGRVVVVDSRPSDAIAVAIRTGAPVFATDEVLVPVDFDTDLEEELAIDIDWGAKVRSDSRPEVRSH
jgi:bifunctional DNase/RNase